MVCLFYTCISDFDIMWYWCIVRVEDFMIDKMCLIENFSCLYVYKYIYIYKSIQVLSVILIFIFKWINITGYVLCICDTQFQRLQIDLLCVSFQHLCIDILYVLFELSCEGEYIVKYTDNKSLDNIK